jgi:hypothetical protein
MARVHRAEMKRRSSHELSGLAFRLIDILCEKLRRTTTRWNGWRSWTFRPGSLRF